MNNEPNITLPTPPTGHVWQYRGMGWTNDHKNTTYCISSNTDGIVDVGRDCAPQGCVTLHYWEAVAVSKTPRTDAVFAAVGENILDHARQLETELDAKTGIVDVLEEEVAQLKESYQRIIDHERMWDPQEIGEQIGLVCGQDIRPNILPGILRLKEQLANWEQTAADFNKARKYYRDLLDQCARAIGKEAYTCDDGTTQGDVLVAKVPELVRDLVDEKAELIEEINRKSEMITRSVLSEIAPDHTEGGKYRMLEAGEIREPGDEYLNHDGWRETTVVGIPTLPDMIYRRRIDYAQQAKDIIRKGLISGMERDTFVDLIIKAAKQ